MLIDDLLKAGDDILASVDKALSTHEYSGLGTELRKVVTDTTSTVVRSGTGAMTELIRNARQAVSYRPPFLTKEVDKNLGKGGVVAGSVIVILAVCLFLGLSLPAMLKGGVLAGLGGGLVLAIMAGIGAGILISGMQSKKLVSRFYEFADIVGERTYITVKELSDKTGISAEKVVADLKKMKMKGFLPTGALDRDCSTLMLTDEVYREYARSVQAARVQEQNLAKEVQRKDAPTAKKTFIHIDEKLPEDVKAILRDGNDYLNKIRGYNDRIPDTEIMSDKLYTLEATVLSIFKKVQKQPEAAGDLRKFMSYYLPTTEKLLSSYVKLSDEDDGIENVAAARHEIEDAMDVINDAFVKLLNQLFQDDAWDISSDISVMKTMMKTMMKQDALI